MALLLLDVEVLAAGVIALKRCVSRCRCWKPCGRGHCILVIENRWARSFRTFFGAAYLAMSQLKKGCLHFVAFMRHGYEVMIMNIMCWFLADDGVDVVLHIYIYIYIYMGGMDFVERKLEQRAMYADMD